MPYTICCGLRLRLTNGSVADLPDVIAYQEIEQGLLYTAPRYDKHGMMLLGDETHFIEWKRISSFVGYQNQRWENAEKEIGEETAIVCWPNLHPKHISGS